MIHKITESLEEIAKSVKSSSDPKKIEEAIRTTRSLLKNFAATNGHLQKIQQLDQELTTWQSKLAIILKEPIGRQGMAKHAQFWVEELRKA